MRSHARDELTNLLTSLPSGPTYAVRPWMLTMTWILLDITRLTQYEMINLWASLRPSHCIHIFFLYIVTLSSLLSSTYVHSADFPLKRSPLGWPCQFYIWLHLYKIFSWVSFQIEPKILHFIIECPLLNTYFLHHKFFPISLFDTEDWITQQFQLIFLK